MKDPKKGIFATDSPSLSRVPALNVGYSPFREHAQISLSNICKRRKSQAPLKIHLIRVYIKRIVPIALGLIFVSLVALLRTPLLMGRIDTVEGFKASGPGFKIEARTVKTKVRESK